MAKTDTPLMDQLLKGVDGLTVASDDGFKFDRIPFGIPQLDKVLSSYEGCRIGTKSWWNCGVD